MAKLVVASHNLKSDALKNLAAELSQRVGYKVWRVTPDKVGKRAPVLFHQGIDKVAQFQAFQKAGVPCPAFATSLEEAAKLDTKLVVVRALTNSSEGEGITICAKESLSQRAPLYTAYIPKKREFRVHVWAGKAFDIQEKRRKKSAEEKEFQVRNTANGYVFCRSDVSPPADCASAAVAAVLALGRTQGAVDIIWNEKLNKSFVLEVNSRPGMEGTTLKKYADAILAV